MSDGPQPPYTGVDWDDELGLEELPAAQLAKAKSHFRLDRWLKVNARREVLTLSWLEFAHRLLFEDLFPEFAGRLRGPSPRYIYRNVTFGYFQGTHADRVKAECDALFERLRLYIAQLDDYQRTWEEEAFAEEVLTVAAYAHCEIIRIHPFVNGNGRVARKCIDYFAWRYGMLPVDFGSSDAERREYRDAVRTWLQGRGLDHFKSHVRPRWEPNPDWEDDSSEDYEPI